MTRARGTFVFVLSALVLLAIATVAIAAASDNPLVFLPGSQPGDVSGFDRSARCENCHSGYDPTVEPGSNWRGSMMAQAARDPLWLACLTVSLQDSKWAIGSFDAGDLCIRCHAPTAWLEGRSEPVNTSALVDTDFDGVQCDFCHRMIDPLSALGQPDVPPETPGGLGEQMALDTQQRDRSVLSGLSLDGGTQFLDSATGLPTHYGPFPAYDEVGGGQFFVDTGSAKSGPYTDAEARHQFDYSRFHKSRELCHTCHDVSNPVLANLASPGTTSRQAAASYFHVERTSSEFALSAYGRGGATADVPLTAFADACQDCHLPDVRGVGCDKKGAPIRDDLPLHDMTGGNQWMLGIIASADQAAAAYDPYNYAILSGAKYDGASIDVLGVQGFGDEISRGQGRALAQLQMAATLSEIANDGASVTIRVKNNTGHKLISGFPEGRRMFLTVRFHDDAGSVVSEVNPYAPLVTVQDTAGNDVYASGGTLDVTRDDLVWEAKMSSGLTGETKTFHFVLADDRYKDNRIPPKGFDSTAMYDRIAQPRWGGADAGGYFTDAEYAGGWDDVTLAWPAGATSYSAELYYQTTSMEYVEFLRDEINGVSNTLGDPTAYIAQSDPFFANLKGWGDALWDLWLHNGGAEPVLMASLGATPEPPEPPCEITTPTGLTAESGKRSVKLSWDAVPEADAYRIYSFAAGKYQLVAETSSTSLNVRQLRSGQEYCFAVSAVRDCSDAGVIESGLSALACATPR